MKNAFQKVTQKSIVTVSVVGALVVVAVVANSISSRNENSRAVDANIDIKDGVSSVESTSDGTTSVSVSSSQDKPMTDSGSTATAGESGLSPEEQKKLESVVVTEPSPGVTKVEGKNFSLTVDTTDVPSDDDEPNATPSPDASGNTSISVPDDAKTRFRIRSSRDEDSDTSSRIRTRIRTTQDGDSTTIRYDSN